MSETRLTYDDIREVLLSAFPELLERIWETFGSYYRLETGTPEEMPEVYPIFEDVVKVLLFELLENGHDDGLLTRLFLFFENMANSEDPNVSRDLLGIAILDPLVYRGDALRQAWKYMGPKTKEFAVKRVCFSVFDEYLRAQHNCFVSEWFLNAARTEWVLCVRPTAANARSLDRYAYKYLPFTLKEVDEICAANALSTALKRRIDNALPLITDRQTGSDQLSG
jgi:hypothetical protein